MSRPPGSKQMVWGLKRALSRRKPQTVKASTIYDLAEGTGLARRFAFETAHIMYSTSSFT